MAKQAILTSLLGKTLTIPKGHVGPTSRLAGIQGVPCEIVSVYLTENIPWYTVKDSLGNLHDVPSTIQVQIGTVIG